MYSPLRVSTRMNSFSPMNGGADDRASSVAGLLTLLAVLPRRAGLVVAVILSLRRSLAGVTEMTRRCKGQRAVEVLF